MNVAPLFSVLYIVGYCDMVKLIMWSKPVCALLCRLPEQESPPCMVRIGRRGHPHRSTQTSASVDADIRIGRRRHPHRSAQTSASVGADCLYFAAHSKSVCTIRSAERPSQRSGMPQCFHLPSTMRAISSPSSTGSSPTSTFEPTFTVSMCSV